MRLANSIFRRYGGLAGEYADASDKTILMSLALDQLKDALKVYGKTSNISLTRSMLEAVDEFKTWGVVPQQLEQAAGQLSDGLLKDKLSELSMIYSAYEGILGRLYLDPLDDIARAGRILETHPYFAGKALFIDEFDGFTANEAGILRAALRQAENVTVSLCMPSARVEAAELFGSPGCRDLSQADQACPERTAPLCQSPLRWSPANGSSVQNLRIWSRTFCLPTSSNIRENAEQFAYLLLPMNLKKQNLCWRL